MMGSTSMDKNMLVTEKLWDEYGPLLDSRALCRVLHFRTPNALNVAHAQGRLPFAVFNIEGRRGLFAQTLDVARWVESSSGCPPNASEYSQPLPSSGKNNEESSVM